VKSLLV
jgi:translation factor GUF1, mitochondrial